MADFSKCSATVKNKNIVVAKLLVVIKQVEKLICFNTLSASSTSFLFVCLQGVLLEECVESEAGAVIRDTGIQTFYPFKL